MKQSRITSFGIFLLLLLATFQISLIFNCFKANSFNGSDFKDQINKMKNENHPKNSAIWGSINITSYQLNHTQHYQNETITIRGNLTYNDGSPVNSTEVGVFVEDVFVNNPNFTAITNSSGNFEINFRIPFNLINYSPYEYEIQVNITDRNKGKIIKNNSLFIRIVPWANLNLTNYAINNNDFYHNETITIEGRLSEYLYESKGLDNYIVSLYVNEQLRPEPEFKDTTRNNGTFKINFTIPFDLNINQTHLLEVNVTHGNWIYDVVLQNNFTISLVPYIRINLTNYMVNNSYNFHNDTIAIKGKVYKYLDYSEGISSQNVSLYIDGQLQSSFKATTDSNGEFQINYIIPSNFGLYQIYKIEVNLTQGSIFINESVLDNYFIFYVKANSDLELTYIDSLLKLPGEVFRVEGILRYDYPLGAGIPNAEINYFWYNSTFQWPVSSFFTGATDGSFSEILRIPTNAYSSIINLNMSFLGDYPNTGYSDVNITNIKLFSNITFNWNVVSKAKVGANINITGQIVSYINNSLLLIVNRSIRISYDGTQIGTSATDENGEFTYIYTIGGRTGNIIIKIELVNSASVTLDSVRIINVTAIQTKSGNPIPPFLIFSLVFFPILIGIIAVLAVFGYRYYKKQEKESRIVRIELDPKLLNLKILKETGRLEESLSYLFNAIFMNLIEAKYNRIRKENETIRDFAIVSVKELKLTPTAIYPFIQKVEEIIYGKPFKITDNEFYKTCELFSPLYFELTGDNFILNF